MIEPSCAEAVENVMDHPDWLALPGRTVAVLGAGAEMGPLTALLRWGARVAGVDLPRPDLWRRVVDTARDRAGTLLVPVPPEHAGSDDPAPVAGLDIVRQPGEVAAWLEQLDGPLVLGNYVYADGRDNVRVATAVDAVTVRLLRPPRRHGARLPGDPNRRVRRAGGGRGGVRRGLRGPLDHRPPAGTAAAHPVRRAAPATGLRAGHAPGICDALVASRAPTTRWPSGSSAGGPRPPVRPGPPCR